MSDLSRNTFNLPPAQEAIRARCFHPTGTVVEFAKDEVEQSVPERFEKIVRLHPNRIAVKTEERTLTYDELNQAANRVAHCIRATLGDKTEPVILVSDHGPGAIITCLGVFKVGKILVVVDPAFPLERIRYVLDDVQAAAILTDTNYLSLARSLQGKDYQVINADDAHAHVPDENIPLRISPDAPAEIRYSSGSAGRPKGIVRNHRRLLYSAMSAINTTHISSDDRLLILRNLSFGSRDVLKGLLAGAVVCPFDIKTGGFSKLAGFINREQITYYSSVPSIFRHFVGELNDPDTLPSMRFVHLGGEPLARRDVESYKRHFPDHCILMHRLSCGEAGNLSEYFITKQTVIDTPIVPAGYPVEGKEIFIVDEDRKELAINQVGEIAVKSRYLSSGYWRKPELTNAKFVSDPKGGDARVYFTGDLGRLLPDGCLVYLGRKDMEVKIRGSKFAIPEVEVALLEHSTVKEAAVVAWERESGEKYLAAYVILRDESGSKANELHKFLRTKLSRLHGPFTFCLSQLFPLDKRQVGPARIPVPFRAQTRPGHTVRCANDHGRKKVGANLE